MEISPNKVWERKEWEEHVNDLLRIKHGQENYVPIPDRHNGDAGIEGFSFCGNAYQAFCPEELCTMEQLYDKQRDKMTTDISKFIDNKKNTLSSILGGTKIKRWILVVPNHLSKHLNSHASTKTAEVVKAKLAYVDNNDFHVLVWDRNTFKSEEAELLEQGIRVLRLEREAVSDVEVNAFQTDKSDFVNNVEVKLTKLKPASPAQIEKARDVMLKQAIYAQNMLGNLKQEYPEYHSQIVSGVIEREERLHIEYFESQQKSPAQQIAALKEVLAKKSKLHEDNLDCIAAGTVADWLMRCNLDFE